MGVVFDKLAFVHSLEAEGSFSRGQAEVLSKTFHTAVSETVATNADLATEIGAVRHEIADVRHEIAQMRVELKLWTGSLAGGLFAAISGLVVAMRLLGH